MSPKILYISPNRGFSGYSHAARDYIRALDSVGANIVTRSLSYDMGMYEPTSRENELQSRNLQNVDIVVAHTTPNEIERKDGVFNCTYFAWETDKLPKEWVDSINSMDLAMVPCEENVKAARKSGVVIPVVKIPHTFDLNKYKIKHEPFVVPGAEDSFKFLSICQFSKKKGLDALLKAYLTEFDASENVLLILKVYINAHQNDGEQERARIHDLVSRVKAILRLPSYPKLCIVHEVMNDSDMGRMHATSDCYVLPSRGEGFSITHFDSMGYGKPAIGVNWGGTREFINKENGWLVDYDLSPVTDMQHPIPYLYTARENWAEPLLSSLRKSLREAYSMGANPDNPMWAEKKQKCLEKVQEFTYDKIGKSMNDAIMRHYEKWKESNAS